MKTHNLIHDPSCATIRDQRIDIDAGLAPCTCGAREKRTVRVPRPGDYGFSALTDGLQPLGNGNYRRPPHNQGG